MNSDLQENINKPKKSGQGVLISLVIVIVLAIAAIAGLWYYMDSNAKKDNQARDKQIQDLQKQIIDLNTSKSSSSNSTQPANTFAVNIPAIGVTLNVADAIKDLEFSVKSSTLPGTSRKVTTASFSTSALTKADPNCAGQIGSISKIDGQYSANNAYGYGASFKQYPDYYLAYSGPQATCSNNQSVISQQTQDVNYLKQAIISTFGLSQNYFQ